ncbi:hypothetical protein GGH19_004461 [Coemansia sp. RSA 1807]|nr:hypothetical protein GGF48_000312 [Coemansia sp. RSA 921]KAJ2167137.1 hypothetical protein GGH15_002311 [Coemansia sp. RSA 562]KAJ2172309.1 hypothetical protein GGH16_002406 [Coemansia sp. RSA 560]KAJ2193612.1 hypothetical protein GGH18_002497 [Coemansia sp. RSA 530]KAJ2198537.1 hypothetical protein IW144_001875 [Coemansia sp. RSA 522]KAJ2207862.1 hypothetical protein IW145_001158 [Coemansia sp. RSA 521]KAJ2224743.1 hypothetical protein EV180_003574 [Coemansia sp. RSA 518]KAJ2277445.1 hyp
MLLNNDEFLLALAELFVATRENGSVTVTLKRYNYEGVKQERQKKRAKTASNEEAMQLIVDRLSLNDTEYATLVRANTEKRKLSTLVAPSSLDVFLARYHGLLMVNAESIKKKDRLKKKKAAVKLLAAKKARSKKSTVKA